MKLERSSSSRGCSRINRANRKTSSLSIRHRPFGTNERRLSRGNRIRYADIVGITVRKVFHQPCRQILHLRIAALFCQKRPCLHDRGKRFSGASNPTSAHSSTFSAACFSMSNLLHVKLLAITANWMRDLRKHISTGSAVQWGAYMKHHAYRYSKEEINKIQ